MHVAAAARFDPVLSFKIGPRLVSSALLSFEGCLHSRCRCLCPDEGVGSWAAGGVDAERAREGEDALPSPSCASRTAKRPPGITGAQTAEFRIRLIVTQSVVDRLARPSAYPASSYFFAASTRNSVTCLRETFPAASATVSTAR